MVITYNGGTSFKVSFGDTTVAFNPVSKQSKLKQTKFGANVALISVLHEDANGIENVTHGDKTPFCIDGPGEYEIEGMVVRGLSSGTAFGDRTQNTIYLLLLEGMRLCFLGYVNTRKLPPETLEALEEVDILFVPIGNSGTLSPGDAHELSVELESHVVIPMQYDATTLKQFLKEEGTENLKPVDKLTIKKKDLEGKSGEVVILSGA